MHSGYCNVNQLLKIRVREFKIHTDNRLKFTEIAQRKSQKLIQRSIHFYSNNIQNINTSLSYTHEEKTYDMGKKNQPEIYIDTNEWMVFIFRC